MKKRNILLLLSFVVGCAYAAYSLFYWTSASAGSSGAEAAGAAIASILVMPHLVCTGVAVVFNGLGYFLSKPTLALVGGILYTVAMVLFPPYFFFVIVEMVLSFVGYAQLKKGSGN